jgi:hypothetical protein
LPRLALGFAMVYSSMWGVSFVFLPAYETHSPTLNPDFPDEPLILAQDLREDSWCSRVLARFPPS